MKYDYHLWASDPPHQLWKNIWGLLNDPPRSIGEAPYWLFNLALHLVLGLAHIMIMVLAGMTIAPFVLLGLAAGVPASFVGWVYKKAGGSDFEMQKRLEDMIFWLTIILVVVVAIAMLR